MKEILSFMVIGILILSGFGVVAGTESDEENFELETIRPLHTGDGGRDYTHTVLVEVGTRTTCPACPASNLAWHNIYEGGNYDFEYTELVYNKNSVAQARFYEFNPKWVPTSYWDGGEYVYPGTNQGIFYNYLDASGSRVVPDLVADLDVEWLGSAEIEITYSVNNNEASNYPGRLRIYVIELVSRWNDYNGNPYYHAFLDFAVNQAIDIPAAGAISDTIVWDGGAAGYPDITPNNIQVILAVFDDEPHQSYSDPPSGNPFWAYYSDECVAATPETTNSPPDAPDIDGPNQGSPGVEVCFTFHSTDPDGGDVKYIIDWDDGNTEETDYYPSCEPVEVCHTYEEQGTYVIKAKAEDTGGLQSTESTHEITIPRNRAIYHPLLLRLFERFLNAFPILRQLLGL